MEEPRPFGKSPRGTRVFCRASVEEVARALELIAFELAMEGKAGLAYALLLQAIKLRRHAGAGG